MIDDQELISGLNSAIERLLRGDAAVAVEEDVDIEVRPYVEIFALLLEDVSDSARPEFRASLRERFVTGAGSVGSRHAGALTRVAGFAAATFLVGSAVNPVLARALVASISETMGGELASVVSRVLDLDAEDEIASPVETVRPSAAGSSSIELPSSPLLPADLLAPSDDAAPVAAEPLPPGLTGGRPVEHPVPAAAGTEPVPPAPASVPPSSTDGRPANSPAAGIAPVIDPPAGGPPTETPPTADAPPTGPTTPPAAGPDQPPSPTSDPAADPAPSDPASPGKGKGNANSADNGQNGANGNPGESGGNGNPGNSGPQQGGQPGNDASRRADAVQAAGNEGQEITPLGKPESAAAQQGAGQPAPGQLPGGGVPKVKGNQGKP